MKVLIVLMEYGMEASTMVRGDGKSKSRLISFAVGVASSLLAGLILMAWPDLPAWSKWATSVGVGVLAFALVLMAVILSRRRTEEKRTSGMKVLKGIRSQKGIRLQEIDVEGNGGSMEVLGDIESTRGDVTIKGVKVRGHEKKNNFD